MSRTSQFLSVERRPKRTQCRGLSRQWALSALRIQTKTSKYTSLMINSKEMSNSSSLFQRVPKLCLSSGLRPAKKLEDSFAMIKKFRISSSMTKNLRLTISATSNKFTRKTYQLSSATKKFTLLKTLKELRSNRLRQSFKQLGDRWSKKNN